MGSTEERWQAFFASPLEWWDNRKDKVVVLVNKLENACIHMLLAIVFDWKVFECLHLMQ